MACTGTATAKVIQDIRGILHFDKNVPCIMGTFNRPNIKYEVRFKDSLNTLKPQGAMADLVAVVKEQHGSHKKKNTPCSGIVYVHKREDCQSLATQIFKVRLQQLRIIVLCFISFIVLTNGLCDSGDWTGVPSLPWWDEECRACRDSAKVD